MTAAEIHEWADGTITENRYEIIRKIDGGGMGVVYLAHDRKLGNDVVVKVPHRNLLSDYAFASRFTLEVRSLAKLNHPHIVKVFDSGLHEDSPFAVMQYLPGGNLKQKIPLARKLQSGQGGPGQLEWLLHIGKALDFIHQQGFVHRDVKPPNILFDHEGNAFLSDFGIAKVISETHVRQTSQLTGQGAILGTLGYMSPQALAGDKLDGRADQYSLSCTLFEVLLGRLPYSGGNPMAVYHQQTTAPVPDLMTLVPGGVPESVAYACRRALHPDPQSRFATCVEFAHAALEFERPKSGSAAHRTTTSQPPPEPAKAAASFLDPCPTCATLLDLSDCFSGMMVQCPGCGAALQVDSGGLNLLPQANSLPKMPSQVFVASRTAIGNDAAQPRPHSVPPHHAPAPNSHAGRADVLPGGLGVDPSQVILAQTAPAKVPSNPLSAPKIPGPPRLKAKRLSWTGAFLVWAWLLAGFQWLAVTTHGVLWILGVGPLLCLSGLAVLYQGLAKHRGGVIKLGVCHVCLGLLGPAVVALLKAMEANLANSQTWLSVLLCIYVLSTGLPSFALLREKTKRKPVRGRPNSVGVN